MIDDTNVYTVITVKTYYVTVSELGEFVYCERAWWLRQQGRLPAEHSMKIGEEKHATLLKTVNRLHLISRIAWILIVASLAVLFIVMLGILIIGGFINIWY